jgi:hypothetical protein
MPVARAPGSADRIGCRAHHQRERAMVRANLSANPCAAVAARAPRCRGDDTVAPLGSAFADARAQRRERGMIRVPVIGPWAPAVWYGSCPPDHP